MKISSTALFATSCLLLAAGTLQAQSGKKENRTVSAFHGISVSGGIDLYLTEGDASVSLDAKSSEALTHIVTEVENGILKIHPENNWRPFGNPHVKAYVSNKELDRLAASGGSDTYLETEMHCPMLKVNLSGGSDLKGKITSGKLDLSQSGGSDAHLSGTVKDLTVDASGGSDLDGYDLVTENASLNASGGSDASLTVQKTLRASASGGSDIHYKGNPSVSNVHASGSSSVVKKG